MGHEQRDAPWMVTAIAKAEKYKGADESIIEQSENFHSLCKVNWIPTMVGRKMHGVHLLLIIVCR